MEAEKQGQKASARGMILGTCPICKGKGKVPKEIPLFANPKAPATRPGRMGFEICSRCQGIGRIGSR